MTRPSTPDTTLDPSTITTVTYVDTTTVDSQAFASATGRPTGPVLTRPTSRLAATPLPQRRERARMWANNTTRRTVDFYRRLRPETAIIRRRSRSGTTAPHSPAAADYERVRYSTNGGTTWTTLQQTTGASALQGWTQHTYSLPAIGSRDGCEFGASVNAATEYVDFDEILGRRLPRRRGRTHLWLRTSTTSLADGTWYFNIRTVDDAGNWPNQQLRAGSHRHGMPPVTTDNAPSGWATAPVTVSLTATDAGSGVAYHAVPRERRDRGHVHGALHHLRRADQHAAVLVG